MSEPFGLFAAEPSTIYLDAVTAIQPDGRELIIEDFENRGWIEFVQRRGTGDNIEFEQDDDPISGERVMAFYPGVGQSPGLRAAHFADPSFCTSRRCTIPTIISADFAERQRLEVGDRYPLRMDTMVVMARVASIVCAVPHAAARRAVVRRGGLRRAVPHGFGDGPASLGDSQRGVVGTCPRTRRFGRAAKEEIDRPRYALGKLFDRNERTGRQPPAAIH